MKQATLLAAFVVSLVLMGSTKNAAAKTHAQASPANLPDRVTLLGKTICLAHAPSTASCDWRLSPSLLAPRKARRSTGMDKVSLFGWTLCLADDKTNRAETTSCDLVVNRSVSTLTNRHGGHDAPQDA